MGLFLQESSASKPWMRTCYYFFLVVFDADFFAGAFFFAFAAGLLGALLAAFFAGAFFADTFFCIVAIVTSSVKVAGTPVNRP